MEVLNWMNFQSVSFISVGEYFLNTHADYGCNSIMCLANSKQTLVTHQISTQFFSLSRRENFVSDLSLKKISSYCCQEMLR